MDSPANGGAALWSTFFDGTTVGLDGTTEDVDAANYVATTGELNLSTLGFYQALGIPGGFRPPSDVIGCADGTCTVNFDGAAGGLTANINALHLITGTAPPPPSQPLNASGSGELVSNVFNNSLLPTDVNFDGRTSAIDALKIRHNCSSVAVPLRK